ncbi:hypothetical protein MUDAN_BIHEEGNE_01337 [Lactiplantibacillus mudanjiangensis]|uniref:hypothetical protein n=1 Tax=Lactiplantibacillus mudanjiangensis TaxID=1296538 RepID=UPI0010147D3B|nr:hypothetical protein MUDAN_BIHEEGNE_01337 [Lactiplantibacillus mudanjiangensis]
MLGIVRSKRLLGFVYGILIIGLYANATHAAGAIEMIATAEVLSWFIIAGLQLQLKQSLAAPIKRQLYRLKFTYAPILGYFFFQNPLTPRAFSYVDVIILAFLILVTLWGYQCLKGRQDFN